MTTGEAEPIGRVDISRLTRAWSASHFVRRVCQLCWSLLIFMLFVSLFSFATDFLVWFIDASTAIIEQSSEPLPAFTGFGAFDGSIAPLDVVGLAIAAIVFAFFAQLRTPWWVLALCGFGLAVNLYAAYLNTIGYGYDWADNPSTDMLTAQSYVPWLYLSGVVLLHVYLIWLAFTARARAQSLADEERQLLRETARDEDQWQSLIKRLANIPVALRYAKNKVWTGFLMVIAGIANFSNFWRMIIVFIFVCLIPPVAVQLFPNVGVVINALLELRNLGRVAVDLTIVAIALGFYLTVIMVIPYFVGVVARWSVRRAEEQMRVSLHDIQHQDNRAPILFLRSFLNDTVPLPKGAFNPARWMFDGAGALASLDMLVLDEGTRVGPTVALGNPDDPAPPYGVARGYFDHATWKDAVMGLCERSAAIIMVLDETEGVDWEIGHIAAKRYTEKTLFLLAPEDVGKERGFMLLGTALARATRRDKDAMIAMLANIKDAPVFGFMLEGGEPQLLTSDALRQYDYLVTVRRFLRTLPDKTDTVTIAPDDPSLQGKAAPFLNSTS